jgi:hypothetical protein
MTLGQEALKKSSDFKAQWNSTSEPNGFELLPNSKKG